MVRKLRTGLMPKKGSLQPTTDGAHGLRHGPRSEARRSRRGEPESRTPDVPAAQSRRVCGRHAGAVRSRHRRQFLSASRHHQRELRQHCRCPDAVGDGDAGLHARGGLRQPRRVGDPSADATSATYDVPRTQSQKDRVDGAPFGTRGGTVVTHNFPADGKYKFQLLLHGEPAGLLFGRTVRDIQMEVAIDGERAALLKVDRWISESDPDGLMVSTPPIQVRAGARRVAATFIREFEGPRTT